MKMGVIAEDDSDVAIIRELTLKLLRPRRIRFKRFVGNGCGKLRRKCRAWAETLVRAGCPWIVVVHDLDDFDEAGLKNELLQSLKGIKSQASVVLIPKREIEAWLLYDPRAIATALNERRLPKLPGNPEALVDPKKYLGDLIWKLYKKSYVNTIHNEKIARQVDIILLQRCGSYSSHPGFIQKVRKHIH